MGKPTDKQFATYDKHQARGVTRGNEDGLECGCRTCLKVRCFLSSRTQPLTVVEVRHG